MEASERLEKAGFSPKAARKYLHNPFLKLNNSLFFEHQNSGLAVFISSKGAEYFRLPVDVSEKCYLGGRFNIKPLLKLFESNGRYRLLEVTLERPRLYEGNKLGIWELDIPGGPYSIKEKLAEFDPEKSLQYSSEVRADAGEKEGIYHGHGIGKDKHKKYISLFYNELDKGVRKNFEVYNLPLVLAGLDHLVSIYRDVSGYPFVKEEYININPHELSEQELHERSWNIVRPAFRAETENVRAEFMRMKGTPLASDDVKEIVKSSYFGKTKYLCLSSGTERWGRFDEGNNNVEIFEKEMPESRDLLNYSALCTIANGGKVYTLDKEEMPGETSVAAIYRY
jgi:hypothetical protein